MYANNEKNINIAMLIDGDNAPHKYIGEMLEELSQYGRITIRRVYGDWSSDKMNGWKKKLSENAIHPVQKFAYVKGKNSTDIALIIDAMDILYKESVGAFCLVSSDSDFTGLANRIRENGLLVIGMGEKKTSRAFTSACDVFIYIENFQQEQGEEAIERNIEKVDIAFLKNALYRVEQEDGSALLSRLGESIRKLDSSFDTRTYGFKNLHQLFKSLENDFEIISHPDNLTLSVRGN